MIGGQEQLLDYSDMVNMLDLQNSSITSSQETNQMFDVVLGQLNDSIGEKGMQKKMVDQEIKRQVLEQNKQQCPICFFTFDDNNHTPMMICQKNQHLCCKVCVPNIFSKITIKCPMCRQPINKKDVTVFRLYGEYIQRLIVLKSDLKQTTKISDALQNQKQNLKKELKDTKNELKSMNNELKDTIDKCTNQIALLNNNIQQKEKQIYSIRQQSLKQDKQHKQRIDVLSFELQKKQRMLQQKQIILRQNQSEIKKLQQQQKNLQLKIEDLYLQIQNLNLNIKDLNKKYEKNDAQKQALIRSQYQKNRQLQKKLDSLKQEQKKNDQYQNDKIGKLLKLDKKDKWQEKGHVYLKRKKTQVACDIFSYLIENNIDDQHEIYGFGCVQDAKGYFQNREQELYFGLIKNQKLRANPYDALGLCYLKNRDFLKAKSWYERMLQLRPNNFRLLFGLANTLYNLNDYIGAERVFREIIGLNPAAEKAYQLIAALYFNFGSAERNAQTKLLCGDSLAMNPQNLYSQFMLSALEQNALKKETQLLAIVEKEPQFVRAKSALASHYISLKLLDKGVQLSEECIAANPLYDRPYLSLGFVHQSKNMNHLAIEEYRKCLQKNPQSQNAYLHLGRLHLKLGNLDKAVNSLGKALEINPSLLRGWEVLAKAYFMKGDIKGCIECYQKCALLSHQKDKYFEAIGDLFYFNLGNQRKAKLYYEKCKNQNPENKQALSQLILISQGQKQSY